MTEPNVTVVVPTYNRVALLQETLNSVLAQTHPPLEVIVVDNGGTDDTESMISKFRDTRICYERIEPTGGPARPRNHGAGLARGSIVSFLDSDDLWKPTKIEDECSLWDGGDADIITCLAREYIDGREGPLVKYPIKDGYLSFNDIVSDNPVVGANFSIKKALFERLGGFDEDSRLIGAEDRDFLLRASPVARFGVVRKVNVLYRLGTSVSLDACKAAIYFFQKNKELLELDESGVARHTATVKYTYGRMNIGWDNDRAAALFREALASRRLPTTSSLDAVIFLFLLALTQRHSTSIVRKWRSIGNNLLISARKIQKSVRSMLHLMRRSPEIRG